MSTLYECICNNHTTYKELIDGKSIKDFEPELPKLSIFEWSGNDGTTFSLDSMPGFEKIRLVKIYYYLYYILLCLAASNGFVTSHTNIWYFTLQKISFDILMVYGMMTYVFPITISLCTCYVPIEFIMPTPYRKCRYIHVLIGFCASYILAFQICNYPEKRIDILGGIAVSIGIILVIVMIISIKIIILMIDIARIRYIPDIISKYPSTFTPTESLMIYMRMYNIKTPISV